MFNQRHRTAPDVLRWAGCCAVLFTVFAQTASAFAFGSSWAPSLTMHRFNSLRNSAAPHPSARCQARKWLATTPLVASSDSQPKDRVEIKEGSFVVDGFRAYYCVAAPPAENIDASIDPIVFVHGAGSSSAHFKRNLGPLAAELQCPVYALDLLGYGKSAKPTGVLYSPALWSWQLETFLDDVVQASSPAFLVGHALGGYACLNFAANDPKKVQGLALLSPAGRYGVLNPSGLDAFWYRWPFFAETLGAQQFDKFATPQAVRETLSGLYSNPSMIDEGLVQELSDAWKGKTAAGKFIFSSLYSADPAPTWEELLSQEEVGYCGPLLAVWGSEDPEVVHVEALKELRPDVDELMVPAGPYAFDEQAEKVNGALAAWVKKHAGTGTDFPIPFSPRYKTLPLNFRTMK